jgi:hypothetical protein
MSDPTRVATPERGRIVNVDAAGHFPQERFGAREGDPFALWYV